MDEGGSVKRENDRNGAGSVVSGSSHNPMVVKITRRFSSAFRLLVAARPHPRSTPTGHAAPTAFLDYGSILFPHPRRLTRERGLPRLGIRGSERRQAVQGRGRPGGVH